MDGNAERGVRVGGGKATGAVSVCEGHICSVDQGWVRTVFVHRRIDAVCIE